LTSNKHKKRLENDLSLLWAGDYKLDFCFKKQTIVTSKGCGALVAVNALVATLKTFFEK